MSKPVEPTEAQIKECPFGIEQRFCRYQETRAEDVVSAIAGNLVFYCKLKSLADCPQWEVIKDDKET